ncbi:hypothetical protein BX600DRAFT_456646 [Xylariales sp. PMI_506]|nr:hypothetical protein BX600DRAFT_456646 [Xylariales sp. PMI_506]
MEGCASGYRHVRHYSTPPPEAEEKGGLYIRSVPSSDPNTTTFWQGDNWLPIRILLREKVTYIVRNPALKSMGSPVAGPTRTCNTVLTALTAHRGLTARCCPPPSESKFAITRCSRKRACEVLRAGGDGRCGLRASCDQHQLVGRRRCPSALCLLLSHGTGIYIYTTYVRPAMID